MARKKKYKIPGVSFSWKRAVGITQAKRKISHATGIPLTKAGRQRKIGRMVSSGCVIYIVAVLCLVALALMALAVI